VARRIDLRSNHLELRGHVDLVHGELRDGVMHACRDLSRLPELQESQEQDHCHEGEEVRLQVVRGSSRDGLSLRRRDGDGWGRLCDLDAGRLRFGDFHRGPAHAFRRRVLLREMSSRLGLLPPRVKELLVTGPASLENGALEEAVLDHVHADELRHQAPLLEAIRPRAVNDPDVLKDKAVAVGRVR